MSGSDSASRSFHHVVDGGYCIGCGACAVARPELYQIAWNEFGEYQARQTTDLPDAPAGVPFEKICPFSGDSLDENTIGTRLYGKFSRYDDRVGYCLEAFAGHVVEGDFRASGSSGGFLTWILCALLERNMTDAIIHVGPCSSQAGGTLFAYGISHTPEEVRRKAKSRYYPIEMSEVLQQVRCTPGNYTFVGLPCFVKAVRLLMDHDPLLKQRIRYCVALVCGHLKSRGFADAIAWESGVVPEKVSSIDFRHKLMEQPANEYGIRIEHAAGEPIVRPMRGLITKDWGMGLFKYRACDYCDDVVGETADLSVGDAWLPQYVSDPRGTNVIVVRRQDCLDLIREANAEGRLHLDPISVDDVARSQQSGFRHRREGLRYRLWNKNRLKQWFPKKRVPPSKKGVSLRYRRIYRLRETIVAACRQAFLNARQVGDYGVFVHEMRPLIKQYQKAYRLPRWRRVGARARRLIGKLFRRIGLRAQEKT